MTSSTTCKICDESICRDNHVCEESIKFIDERFRDYPIKLNSVEHLKKLHRWLWYLEYSSGDRFRDPCFYWKERLIKEPPDHKEEGWPIRLDYNQWEAVLEAIRFRKLPVNMENTAFGFNIKVSVYTHSNPIFPGAIIKPELVLSIAASQLPHGHRLQFKKAWEILSPITHNKENEKLLKQNGFPKLKGKTHYDY
jgi:hypothetical protein